MARMAATVTLERAQTAREEFLRTLTDLVIHESPTGAKQALDALADPLQRDLEGRGWEVRRHARSAAGDVLEAAMRGGAAMKVQATSGRGNPTNYTFSLRGLTAALNSIQSCQ